LRPIIEGKTDRAVVDGKGNAVKLLSFLCRAVAPGARKVIGARCRVQGARCKVQGSGNSVAKSKEQRGGNLE
jgi:hypothetical protein